MTPDETQVAQDAESLSAEVSKLRAALADTESAFPIDWRLTSTEEKFLRVLLAQDIATRDAIGLVTGVKAYPTQGVHMSRLRAKLKAPSLTIETIHGRGWRLVGRDAWRSVLSAPAA